MIDIDIRGKLNIFCFISYQTKRIGEQIEFYVSVSVISISIMTYTDS